ncbi:MAG: chemotaxis protein CheB [Roseiflexaceae bacterium]
MGNTSKDRESPVNKMSNRKTAADKRTTPASSEQVHAGKEAQFSVVERMARQPFFVVGMGAAAGGLQTFEQFFMHMPPDSGMAFVVTMHLDPTHKSMLPELLSRYTRMVVLLAEDGVIVEPDTVYAIPSNMNITIRGGQLHLERPAQPRGPHYPIDHFLCSLAIDQEEHAIAVILSGTGSDGAQGVKAIKETGGIVVVQEGTSARYPSMPQSAIATGVVDLVVPVERMPEKILEITSRTPVFAGVLGPAGAQEIADHLRMIFRIINSYTNQDFSSYKMSTIVRRIEQRMAVNNIRGIDAYITLLEENPEETRTLYKDILMGTTGFFLDPKAFEILKRQVIPHLFAGHDSDDPVRIWLAGCATGEEAYSVAILIRAYIRAQKIDARVQIFATDLDEEAIDYARAGVYPDTVGANLAPEYLRSFFKQAGNTYQVVKPLREMIIFAQHNLIKDPPFSRIDLLVCRNLLTYLNPDVQKQLLPSFFQALKPHGYLFLGPFETVGACADLFAPIDEQWKIFQRRDVERHVGMGFPITYPWQAMPPAEKPTRSLREEGISPGALAEKILIQRYCPPCVVINEQYEVVYFPTHMGPFLEPPMGEPTYDILRMAKGNLRPALQAAIHKALSDQAPIVYWGLQVTTADGVAVINLRVEPITSPSAAKRLAIVVFERSSAEASDVPQIQEREITPATESAKDVLIGQLEEHLRISHEQLQATVERLESSNEALMSTNEALMSMNAKFQSINEELETTKEELQSLNEELVMVNAEQRSKVEELIQTSSDRHNLLNSSEIATIFLDRQLMIKGFTPAVVNIFNLIPSDIGRPLQHISSKLDYPDLQRDTEQVLEQLTPIEREVATANGGSRYLTRVLPYQTIEDVIDGVVVTLVDITARKRAEDALHMSEERFAKAFKSSPVPSAIILVDDGRIIDANDAWQVLFGYSREETLGRTTIELDIVSAEVSEQLFETMRVQSRIRNQEITVRTKPGELLDVLFSLEEIELDSQRCLLGILVNITERKHLEAALRQSQKMQALGTLAGGIAHDFNNILTSIIGNIELAIGDLPPDHPVQVSLTEVEKASLRASDLVRRILTFSRPQEPKLKVMKFQPVIEEALRLLRSTLPAMIQIGTNFAADVPDVSVDTTQIHQVMMNLGTNAAHAMGELGGLLDIRLASVMVDADRARISAELHEGRYAWLSISDNGSGMDKATIERIFEPFFTTKGPDQGTGLGLSVVHGIMQSHHGAITVYSEPGKGTQFDLYFPAAEGAATETQPVQHDVSRGHCEHVLYVDDEPSIVALMIRKLERLGYRATGYTDAIQALQAFRSGSQDFDVVVTDLAMPGMSGFDLARELLHIRPEVPIIMTSGYLRPEDTASAQRLGLYDFILKSDIIQELGGTLHRLFLKE